MSHFTIKSLATDTKGFGMDREVRVTMVDPHTVSITLTNHWHTGESFDFAISRQAAHQLWTKLAAMLG